MRRPTEFRPRRVSRRLGPLFAMPAMLLLIAMAPGAGGQALRPLGWPGSAPAAALRFPGPAHGLYLVISAQHLRDIRAVAPKLAATLLARRTTIVLSPGPAALTGKRAALGTAFFTSYADFAGSSRGRTSTPPSCGAGWRARVPGCPRSSRSRPPRSRRAPPNCAPSPRPARSRPGPRTPRSADDDPPAGPRADDDRRSADRARVDARAQAAGDVRSWRGRRAVAGGRAGVDRRVHSGQRFLRRAREPLAPVLLPDGHAVRKVPEPAVQHGQGVQRPERHAVGQLGGEPAVDLESAAHGLVEVVAAEDHGEVAVQPPEDKGRDLVVVRARLPVVRLGDRHGPRLVPGHLLLQLARPPNHVVGDPVPVLGEGFLVPGLARLAGEVLEVGERRPGVAGLVPVDLLPA